MNRDTDLAMKAIKRKLLLLLPITLLASACANNPLKKPIGEQETERTSTSESTASTDLSNILQLLQDGHFQQARSELQAYLRYNPRSPTARSLLQQLDADPVEFLGRSHRSYTVKPGDSLSQIASQHLGDATLFLILARYNNIERPRTLFVGQQLKIPVAFRSVPQNDEATIEKPSIEPTPTSQVSSASVYRQRIERHVAAGEWEEALAAVQSAQDHRPTDGSWDHWLNPLSNQVNAQLWQQRALAQLENNQHEEAFASFERALSFLPDLQPAKQHHATLRSQLVNQYHEAAIVHYRNQQLDEAIALWEKVLTLDPDHELAKGFRLRAQDLQRRLKELESSRSNAS